MIACKYLDLLVQCTLEIQSEFEMKIEVTATLDIFLVLTCLFFTAHDFNLKSLNFLIKGLFCAGKCH